MSDLHTELTEIRGVGDRTADKILEVLDDHEQDHSGLEELLQDALDYHQQEDYEFSEQYLREALEQF